MLFYNPIDFINLLSLLLLLPLLLPLLFRLPLLLLSSLLHLLLLIIIILFSLLFILFLFSSQIHSPCTSLESHTILLRFRLLKYLLNSDLLYCVTQFGSLFTYKLCFLFRLPIILHCFFLPCLSYLYISKFRTYFP